jgi:antitoxin component of RelBE/YafQ-DinJ toxin-antitoxin module
MAAGMISFRINPEAKRKLRALAGSMDMSMSDYIVDLLERDIAKADKPSFVVKNVPVKAQNEARKEQK